MINENNKKNSNLMLLNYNAIGLKNQYNHIISISIYIIIASAQPT